MRSNRLSYTVILLFALLQCFVPLLHAHANGLSISHGIHLHETDGLQELHPIYKHGQASLFNDADEGAVITAAQELKQDYSLRPAAAEEDTHHDGNAAPVLLSSFYLLGLLLQASVVAETVYPPAADLLWTPAAPAYTLPTSQAPPARA